MDAKLPRIAPFALFMAFIGIEELARLGDGKGILTLPPSALYTLYPVKVVLTGTLLVLFRKQYQEIVVQQLLNLRHLAVSLLCGTLVYVLWIRMDLVLNPLQVSQGYNPFVFETGAMQIFMIGMRLFGAVLVVPIMEELFWRSFLLRYIINPQFLQVPIGMVTLPSLLVSSFLFGLEHHLFLAGVMAGIGYTVVLFSTRSIAHCILSHAVTNLLLGIHVLITRQWSFW